MTTLTLLHGAYGAPEEWEPVKDLLSGDVSSPWLPGHDPRGPHSEPSSLEEMWTWAAAEVCSATADADVVVGYSLGARLALAAALDAARPPRALVLVSATAGLDNDAERRARRALDDERADAFARDPPAFLTAFWSLPLFAGLTHHPERDALLAARAARHGPRARRLGAVLAGLSPGRAPSLWPRLSTLRAPVWLVVGERDDAYVAAARHMSSLLPQAKLCIVSRHGHALPLEAPRAVADVIDDARAAACTSGRRASGW